MVGFCCYCPSSGNILSSCAAEQSCCSAPWYLVGFVGFTKLNSLLTLFSQGFDSVHLRANIPRLHEAIKFGNTAGDAVYTCLAHIHLIQTRLFVCDHSWYFLSSQMITC